MLAAWGPGGAWQCDAGTPAPELKSCDTWNVGSTATTTGERDWSCAEAGCTKGACVDGIVAQHSWLCSWLCDEQGMVLQHCIASPGVVIAPQSIAYTAIARATAMSKIGLRKRIHPNLFGLSVEVNRILGRGASRASA